MSVRFHRKEAKIEVAIPKILQKHAHLISDISDERNSGDGYWVYFKPGWINNFTETHCAHEDSATECAKIIKLFVVPCNCSECK